MTGILVMGNWSWWSLAAVLAIAAVGSISAILYWRRARRLDSLLIACASVSLTLLMLPLEYQRKPEQELLIDSRQEHLDFARLRSQLMQANTLRLQGDGLFASEWRDLPPKKLIWDKSSWSTAESLSLTFSQQISFGRVFELTVERPQARGEWRVQLIAENQQVLAEQTGKDASISVRWLPPVAERMVLKARVLDEKNQLIDQGPIPLDVIAMPELRVQGRFAAPSFDTQTLNQLLIQSHAVIDWQIQIGKDLVRRETARTEVEADLLVQDAAYFEQMPVPQRTQVLAQIAAGRSLLILGANAQQAAVWKNTLDLNLRQQASVAEEQEWQTPQAVHLHSVRWMPQSAGQSAWYLDPVQPWLASRSWGKGKIVWIAAAGWHQALISEPQALKQWWQSLIDQSAVTRAQSWEWESSQTRQGMPLAGQSWQICGRGNTQGQIQISTENGTSESATDSSTDSATKGKRLPLRAYAAKAEAQCAGFWPIAAGWYDWQVVSADENADNKVDKNAPTVKNSTEQGEGALYVYAATDWPTWQRQLKRIASAAYGQQIPDSANTLARPGQRLPAWPFILFSMLCLLVLWRREQA
ncbi:hypothetical protein [Undibacterium flavidum]|uniref:Uncharacterized protein n=1 Tax=Undibacterium flavidum TaxID=2762297 RepID=A0ABR6YF83_9BURK|nr:hypothetical protein [Undibacterium flavidum]MBC3875241.1 hypothetical protein [Undibacterium flavidum]